MTIQIDTREHKTELKRIEPQLTALGVDFFKSKLYVGDYMSLDNPRIAIDRKKDLLEICGNVCQQHERFRNELIRANKHGIKLIILCENGEGIESLEDVYFWQNPRNKPTKWVMQDGHPVKVPEKGGAVTGDKLYKSLCTIRDRYNVSFEFCEKSDTGRRIVELLGGRIYE